MNPDDLPPSPRENANFISKLFFWWIIKLFRLGGKRELELEDLYRVPAYDKSQFLGDSLDEAWREQVAKCDEYNKKHNANSSSSGSAKQPKVPSLCKAIIKVFWLEYSLLAIFAFTEECIIKIVQPICLGLLLRYFAGEFLYYEGYLFAGGVVLASALYTTQHHPYFFGVQHCGMKMRVACSSVVYRKALRLSQSSLGKTTIGQLVNFLSNDVNRFDQSTGFLHYLWIGPLQLAIVIYILWGYFGWPCLAGIALLVLFVPFQSQMGRLFSRLRLQIAGRTDKRIRIMNEIVSAMRVIKMYTWEKPFAKMVSQSRKDEVKVIRKAAALRAINLSMYYISSKVIIFLTLLAYVLTGNFLTAEKVFVALSLYNNVRLIMTLFFPYGIAQLAEVLVSIKRLQDFLLLEERERTASTICGLKNTNEKRNEEKCVKVTNLSAKWSFQTEELTLSNVSFVVKPGQLAAIIGPVGAGKGSLLQAILSELPALAGEVTVSGKLAYTAQEPWVFSGSVKENILFGRQYEEKWYQQVIEACALKRDLTLLPYSDNTLVGDRGTSLSGGQKARVNLARAVYANADIYLLDDPLSAVDAEVGRHLFEKCIMGILREKICILVTHQLQFLKPADEIILLDNGRVQAQGSYADLLSTGINFTSMLQQENEHQNSTTSTGNSGARQKKVSDVTPPSKNKTEFRRCASMSAIEMGMFSDLTLPEEFEPEEPDIAKSYSYKYDHNSLLMRSTASKKKYGTFTKSGESDTEALIPDSDGSSQPRTYDEIRSTGDISFSLYWKYVKAGSNCCTFLIFLISNLCTQVLFTGSDYFLQYWTKTEENTNETSSTVMNDTFEVTSNDTNSGYNDLEPLNNERTKLVIIYSGIIASLFFVSLIRTYGFFNICMTSSVNLHRMLFHGVLRAPMRFFEVNPVGRVLNRFAKDIGIIDETLPPTLFDTMEVSLQVIGISIIVSLMNPILMVPSLLLGVLFYFIRGFYLKTARSVKRLEGVARSPVFSHLSTSLYGLTTIRAFGVERDFESQFDAHQDLHSASWYLFLATARWLGITVDWISVFYIATVTFSFMFVEQDGAGVGLAVSSAMTLTGLFQWGVRQSAEAENQMVSVERVLEYSNLASEPPLESLPGRKPHSSWPSKGQIIFKNVFLKYGDEPPVLRDVSCIIESREKVGIVGRTGAGKSSLITTLFRIAEPFSGTIEIDGVNTLKLGLHDLRGKISIIPQDPVLFMGSVRRNLDPLGSYTDHEIWRVLQDVHLDQAVKELAVGLDTEIAEGGSNFSVGQRQLVCLGRAILRKNKILILDEATANVDHETDALIQKTIRTKFSDCTVLTVAHRLHTVMDSDKIMVLDSGQIREFNEPYNLLLNPKSLLYSLAQQTGKSTSASLLHMAKMASEKRKQQPRIASVVELNEIATDSDS